MARIAPEILSQTAQEVQPKVIATLQQLTRWAYPQSQVSAIEVGKWQLWHTTEKGARYVDVTVSLVDNGKRIIGFGCYHQNALGGSKDITTLDLTYESLNDALRNCIIR